MNGSGKAFYQAQEFANLAGVTVRALHHYDRLALLKPARTESGYRMYRERDLERLEKIVALKFIGVPLKRIRALLDGDPGELRDALHMQRRLLEGKRLLLDDAIGAIKEAEAEIEAGKRPDSALLKKIIEVIAMQNNTDWMMKYYSEEGKAKVDARRPLWSPELQERVSKEWSDLFRDVEAALGEDPAGPRAQALVARWKKLVEGFTGGDADITAGLKNLYADRANWPGDAQEKMGAYNSPRVWDFIQRAMKSASGG